MTDPTAQSVTSPVDNSSPIFVRPDETTDDPVRRDDSVILDGVLWRIAGRSEVRTIAGRARLTIHLEAV